MGNYPNKTLSGAGVVYKFCKYFDMKYGYNYADDFLDLAAVGIIGDVMELNDIETRYIVKNGAENCFYASPTIDGKKEITLETARQLTQNSAVKYDRGGDEHYDIISASHSHSRQTKCWKKHAFQ